MAGLSGAEWHVDAKAIREDGRTIIVECRRYPKSRLKQEAVAAIAHRVHDTGSAGGIIVSPLGLQRGAMKVASAANIVSIQLGPDATPESFRAKVFDTLIVGATASDGVIWSDSASIEVE